MKRFGYKHVSSVLVAAAIGTVVWVNAGSLTPPGGPVAPTMKTLVQVEPRGDITALSGSASAVHTISQPGSYYLTADVVGTAGKHGIEVTVAGVSIDLRGFQVIGAPGSLDGINLAAGDATISEGSVTGWGGSGVNICDNAIIRNVRARGCVTGFTVCRGRVIGCVTQQNTTGFIGFGALFRDCTATSNSGTGLSVSNGSNVTSCVSSSNTRGIVAGGGSLVTGCTAFGNTVSGIEAADNCRIVGNDIDSNTGVGLLVYGTGNTIDANSLTRNGTGLRATTAGHWIVRNAARGNTAGYVIAAGNDAAQIVNAPGANFVVTNAWANFDDACPPGQALCGGMCISVTTDPNNCGGCNAQCSAGPNQVASCVNGTCQTSCSTDYSDCNGLGGDGCEIFTAGTVAHCGACNNQCPGGPNATPVCSNSVCDVVCSGPFRNCDNNPNTGCEVNSNTDVNNCGNCGQACPNRPNSTRVCNAGVCSFVCNTGFANCNGNPNDGCEVNTNTDDNHCGACNNVCSGPFGNCVNGSCQ